MKKRNKMLSLLLAAMLAFQTVPYAGLNTGNEPVAVVAQAAAKKAEITNVNTKTLTIEKGEVFQLKANRTDVKWKSSNKNVVTVSKTGKLKGKNGGTATVTALLLLTLQTMPSSPAEEDCDGTSVALQTLHRWPCTTPHYQMAQKIKSSKISIDRNNRVSDAYPT